MVTTRNAYRNYLEGLKERDAKVVQWKDGGDLTFDQIGELLGVTRARAHQIYNKAKQAQGTKPR